MPHPFKVDVRIEVDATPAEVWEAIATGPGIDGWFLGVNNTVEPREGGLVRLDFGGASGDSTITAWDPPHHFAHGSAAGPDGVSHAFEYIVEGRDGGTTVVRLVHSGFLGDDWEAEYEALNEGDFMYLHLMAQYLRYFRGRRPVAISVWQPDTSERAEALARLRRAMGISAVPVEGTPVSFTPDGLPPIDGVVDFVSPTWVGVRTSDALYRFLHSPQGVAYLGHHIYRDDIDEPATKAAWSAWLERTFAA